MEGSGGVQFNRGTTTVHLSFSPNTPPDQSTAPPALLQMLHDQRPPPLPLLHMGK